MTLPVIATDIILQSSDGVYALTAIHKQILPSPPPPPPKQKKMIKIRKEGHTTQLFDSRVLSTIFGLLINLPLFPHQIWYLNVTQRKQKVATLHDFVKFVGWWPFQTGSIITRISFSRETNYTHEWPLMLYREMATKTRLYCVNHDRQSFFMEGNRGNKHVIKCIDFMVYIPLNSRLSMSRTLCENSAVNPQCLVHYMMQIVEQMLQSMPL